jgi:hypothetical protein
MMELRWYWRPGWDGPEKVLQYRVKVPLYRMEELDSLGNPPTPQLYEPPQYMWSMWKDVPEEEST